LQSATQTSIDIQTAKDRPEARDISDWTRKGPLPDLPGQRRPSDRGFGSGRGGGFDGGYAGSDAGSERGERRRAPYEGDGKSRDFGNWERRGPLSPSPDAPREGGRGRGFDGPREPREPRQAPAWGEGRADDGARGPRREFQPSERPQYNREPTAPERESQWRTKMRPDAPSPTGTPEASTPSSPAPQPAAPAGRPRLNLAKRTVSEAQPAQDAAPSDKPNPFGAARPIDTAAREKEIEEKRQLAIRQKKEADDKAREEKRAKEASEKAASKEAASKETASKETASKEATPTSPTSEKKENDGEEKPRANFEILSRVGEEDTAAGQDEDAAGEIVDDKAVKPQEVVRDPPKSEGSWRRKSNTPAAPEGTTTETMDDDGWSTVTKPVKNAKNNRRGGPPARAIAS
jgi:translation initiation factor 4B